MMSDRERGIKNIVDMINLFIDNNARNNHDFSKDWDHVRKQFNAIGVTDDELLKAICA